VANLDNEVDKIRQRYEFRDQSEVIKSRWTPFRPAEIRFRNYQQTAIANAFRSVGWDSFEGKKILDVGCGSGRILRQFVDYGALPENLYGTDVSESRIASARALSPNIGFSLSRGDALDFADGSFDVVTQFVVFSSIYTESLRNHLAREMTRVLKPGGYIFWWDTLQTVHEENIELLDIPSCFPGMPVRSEYFGQGLSGMVAGVRSAIDGPVRVLLRRGASHMAALIGPKL